MTISVLIAGWLLWERGDNSAAAIERSQMSVVEHDRVPTESEEVGAGQPSVSSIQKKQLEQLSYAVAVTGLSEEEIAEAYRGVHEAFYDPDSRHEFVLRLHEALSAGLGEDEANFMVGVYVATEWQEVESLIGAREIATGQNYDSLRMVVGLAHNALNATDIETLMLNGTAAPDDLILQLASHGKVDDIIALGDKQLIADVNFVDPFSGRNALSQTIQTIGFKSYDYDSREAAEMVRKLIRHGIAVQSYSGGLDPLDYALQANQFNGDLKLAMARELVAAGARVEQSHRDLLAQMPDIEEKEAFRRLLNNP